jgi:glucose-1-phosphate thymidylyltransferase
VRLSRGGSRIGKAVILAAGSASRMQEGIERYVTDRDELSAIRGGEKMAASFGRFPFLDYQILNLVQSGLQEVNIVLKPENDFFLRRYGRHARSVFPEVSVSFSFQEITDGTAHAVLCAEGFVGDDPFILLNGDNHYSADAVHMLMDTPSGVSGVVAYDRLGFNAMTRGRIESFAVVETNEGYLSRIVEKAEDPERFVVRDFLFTFGGREMEVDGRVLVSMNLWCFGPAIMDACRNVPRHMPRKAGAQGEFELPDAVGLLLGEGHRFVVYYANEDVLDLTRPEDIEIVGQQIRRNLVQKIEELERRWSRVRADS